MGNTLGLKLAELIEKRKTRYVVQTTWRDPIDEDLIFILLDFVRNAKKGEKIKDTIFALNQQKQQIFFICNSPERAYKLYKALLTSDGCYSDFDVDLI